MDLLAQPRHRKTVLAVILALALCPGGAGRTLAGAQDADADGVADAQDNCPDDANPDQADADQDGAGAECDCDDLNGAVHPGAPEACNRLDDDCDGCVDEGACPGSQFRAAFAMGGGLFSQPRGIGVDPGTGRIYVVDLGRHRVEVFDTQGQVQFGFGGFGTGNGQLRFPTAIALDSQGRVLVADTGNDRIHVFGLAGDFRFTFGGAGDGDGQFQDPEGVAVDPGGRIFVTDGLDRLQAFDAAGSHLFTAGASGSGVGEFVQPGRIAVDGQGRIHVVDLDPGTVGRVVVFDRDGMPLFDYPVAGPPGGITADARGRTWVALRTVDRLAVFDATGRPLSSALFNPPTGAEPVLFDVFRSGDRAYVSDVGADVVWALEVDGDFDGDGFPLDFACPEPGQDCNDAHPAVFPDAPEVCDGVNNDCEAPGWPAVPPDDADADGDGFAPCSGDCDEGDPSIYSGAPEICDRVANDCDAPDWPAPPEDNLDVDGDGFAACADCDDGNALRFPGAVEVCDRLDNDCDGCRDDGLNACSTSGTPPQFLAATADRPLGVAIDPASGRIAVAHRGARRLDVYAPGGSLLFTAGEWGSEPGQFQEPMGVAVDGGGQFLVSDHTRSRVLVFDAAGEFQFEFVVPSPRDVDVDANGRIVVVGSHYLARYDSSGTLLDSRPTFGTGDGEFVTPRGVHAHPTGDIYVADTGNRRIQVFDSDLNHRISFGGPGVGALPEPRGVSVDASGLIYVADYNRLAIEVYRGDGSHVVAFPRTRPEDVAVSGARMVTVGGGVIGGFFLETDADLDGAIRHTLCSREDNDCDDGDAATFPGAADVCDGIDRDCLDFHSEFDGDLDGVPPCGGDCDDLEPLVYPGAPELCDGIRNDCDDPGWPTLPPDETDADGDGFPPCAGDCDDLDPGLRPGLAEVCDGNDDDCDGCLDEGLVGCGVGERVDRPLAIEGSDSADWGGVAADPAAGRFVLSDAGNHRVGVFGADGTPAFEFGDWGTAPGHFRQPSGVAFDASGGILVADRGNNRVQRFDAGGAWQATLGGLIQPHDVAADATGRVYVADTLSDRIRVFVGDQPVLDVGTSGSGVGQLLRPEGVAVDGTGRIWVADTGNDRIQVFGADGAILFERSAVGANFSAFDAPRGVAVGPSGQVWVADTSNSRLRVFDSAGNHLVDFDTPIAPRRLAFEGDRLLVTQHVGNAVREIRFLTDADLDGVAADATCPGVLGDNCPAIANRGQSDRDADGVGDACDLDDGSIRLHPLDREVVAWQSEVGFEAWNAYRGDLATLRDGGDVTQAPGSHPLVAQACGLSAAQHPWPENPAMEQAVYFLAAGVADGVEGSLGDATAGPRLHAHPCP